MVTFDFDVSERSPVIAHSNSILLLVVLVYHCKTSFLTHLYCKITQYPPGPGFGLAHPSENMFTCGIILY